VGGSPAFRSSTPALEQAAQCLDISLSTADRAWRYARAWLYHAMAEDNSEKNNFVLTCFDRECRM
jgi:hypothetical protein